MKNISAYIREERLPFVLKSLEKEGVYGITVSQVMGRGTQKGISLRYRGSYINIDLLPKIHIEVIVPDQMEERVCRCISTHAFTGKPGDGRIFVFDVEKSIRVRTFEVEA
ncbi:MAG: P-II family nitrogen regulator [Methanolinea sp.]|jgi:nitrogen regulatory protein P-II 1